jgi:DNA-binding IclR family transcriptional regulator
MTNQSAGRALDLLEAIARGEKPQGLMELAGRLALDKTTTARLLAVLSSRGLVSRDPTTRKYSVGPALLSLAAVAMRRSDLVGVAIPYLEQLRDTTGETVSFHLRVGQERVCVYGVESRHAVRRVAPLGEPLPLWAGPSGKVILAFLPEAERAAILQQAEAQGVDPDRLAAQLELAREQGHLVTIGDRIPGVGAISVPVLDAGSPVASITVAGPADRWARQRMAMCVPEVVAAAAQVSAALGGRRM